MVQMATIQDSNGFAPAKLNPAPSIPPQTAGSKRKRESAAKFYGVRIGKTPGIYRSWNECLQQVTGFPKAAYKSFSTLTEASDYVAGEDSLDGTGKVVKWYGVQAGRQPGVYTKWQDVMDQITGWKGPKHKAFKTKAEAEAHVAEASRSTLPAADGASKVNENGETASKKAKTSKSKKSNGSKEEEESPIPLAEQGEYEPGEAPLFADAEDGFDPNLVLDPISKTLRYKTREEREKTTYQAVRPALDAPIRIYTDGSSLHNGHADALGGVGVYFGPGDRRNISEPLAGNRQTNQRAELTAVLRALEVAPKDRKITIVSDSKYAIDCVTDWFRNWQKNGWVNAARKPVENKDLVQKILDQLEERHRLNRHRMVDGDEAPAAAKRAYWNRGPGGVLFEWVKGHNKDASNNAADCLAVAGARAAQELNGEVDLDD